MNIRLKIRSEKKAAKVCTVYIAWVEGGRNYWVPTSEKVNPQNWDQDRQQVMDSELGASHINDRLRIQFDRVQAGLTAMFVQGVKPTPELIDKYAKGLLKA